MNDSGYIDYKIGDRINNFIEVKDVKEGGLGKIYFGFCHKRKMNVVVKTIKSRVWRSQKLWKVWKTFQHELEEDTLPISQIVELKEYLLFTYFREARVTCQVNGHRNVIGGLNLWWTKCGQLFFVCEYFKKSNNLFELQNSVFNKTKKRSLGILESMHIAISFCNAMIYINNEVIKSFNNTRTNPADQAIGFVHRDIKPDNILINNKNIIKIIDFGLAKYITPGNPITQSLDHSPKIGNPRYMSPEQLAHYDNVTPASDIYSFGVTLYDLLGGNLVDIMGATHPSDIADIEDVPEMYMNTILKCLSTLISSRFQNFRELKLSLIELVKAIKTETISIKENGRCSLCGYVYNGQIKVEGFLNNSNELFDKETKKHIYIKVVSGKFWKGCNKEHSALLMKKFSDNLNGEGFKDSYERVNLKQYYIDQYPVTNKQYFKFIKNTGYKFPEQWSEKDQPYPEDENNHPVTNISFNDAKQYCNWAGCRLPTGDEWEKAARGEEGLLYPWGNHFSEKNCNTAESGNNSIVSVTEYENGASPYGCYQMVGNVSEWVDESHPQSDEFKYVRGGSYGDSCELFGLPFLHDLALRTDSTKEYVGFRTVVDQLKKIRTKTIPAATVLIESTPEPICPNCDGKIIPFHVKDIKVPENNIYTWNGFFDIE